MHGPLDELQRVDFGDPLHSLVIMGEVSAFDALPLYLRFLLPRRWVCVCLSTMHQKAVAFGRGVVSPPCKFVCLP